jgi:hypothetical protein
MIERMRGSLLLAVLGLPLAACSVLLDWNDYTGGVPDSDGGVNGVSDSGDGSLGEPDATDAAMSEPHDASDAAAVVEAAVVEAASPDAQVESTCVMSKCPTSYADITVAFQACCLSDGGCGILFEFQQNATCMSP